MKSMKLKMFTKKCRKENIRNEFYHEPMRIGSKMVSFKIEITSKQNSVDV